MTDREQVVLRTAMHIAYAQRVVDCAAEIMVRLDARSAEEIRAVASELNALMERVRAMRNESGDVQPAPASDHRRPLSHGPPRQRESAGALGKGHHRIAPS
jgi:hypothetical protein